MNEKYQKQLENIAGWVKGLVAENTLLWAVHEAAEYVDDLALYGPVPTKEFERLNDGLDVLNSDQTRLSKLHPDCRGPWERGDTHYPTGEHIRDCDKCLEWNRHPDRHSVGEGQESGQ